MLDLDDLERAVRNNEPVYSPKNIVLQLVAELRAARPIIEALHRHDADWLDDEVIDALAAYDRVAGEVSGS